MEYERRMTSAKFWGVVVGLVILVILFFVLLPFTIVNAGERGVVLHLGKVDRVLGEGFHWVSPFTENVEKMDVTTQKDEVSATSASADLQTVTAVVAVNYRLDPDRVDVLWADLKREYKSKVIDPAVQEAVKSATARFTAEELITKRPEVKDAMKVVLAARLNEKFISLDDISIVDFAFSSSFNAAIEAKVTAEQSALEAQNKLEQVKFEAQQKIETARAEAESVRLQAQALSQNSQFIELRRLEVELEQAKRWNGVLPVNVYGSAPIPFINVGQ